MAEIRRLAPADRPQWLERRIALWPEQDPLELGSELDAMLADPDHTPVFGAFEGRDMLGFAEASEREWGDGCATGPVAWVEAVYVDPDHRRRGLGRQLIDAIADWAKDRGFSELGSDALVTNEVSQASHRNWGFEETERVVKFRRNLR